MRLWESAAVALWSVCIFGMGAASREDILLKQCTILNTAHLMVTVALISVGVIMDRLDMKLPKTLAIIIGLFVLLLPFTLTAAGLARVWGW